MYPVRWNPSEVVIRQLRTSGPTVLTDPDYGEMDQGRKKEYFSDLVLQAQIVYGEKDARAPAITGDVGEADGHLTFKATDLEAQGVSLSKGDLIVSIAGFPVNYKIIEVRPSGHLRGRNWLVLAYFKNNDEIRARRER